MSITGDSTAEREAQIAQERVEELEEWAEEIRQFCRREIIPILHKTELLSMSLPAAETKRQLEEILGRCR